MGNEGQNPFHAAEKTGAKVSGKYRLVRKLARGGMGSVWHAMDESLERPVAIKFMAPAITQQANLRQRFFREAKAAARLRTPHVVQVYEHGVDDDVPFIVMELLEGEDLHTRLRRERRVPLDEAAQIIAQMAKGLRAAHDAGIIHRDLKPHNIYLAQQDGDVIVKVLDFGVAKMEDLAGESTKTGAVLGSPHYMSPEQARGLSNVDHRADVWSMAVIAFRMITGKMAFRGRATGDVIVKICTEPIPVPSEVYRKLPPEIDAFFETALQRKPDKRFQTAVALSAAFAEAVRRSQEGPVAIPKHVPYGTFDDEKTAKLATRTLQQGTAGPETVGSSALTAATTKAGGPPSSVLGGITKATPRHGSPPTSPPNEEDEHTSVDDGWELDEDDAGSMETIPSAPQAQQRSHPSLPGLGRPDFTGPFLPIEEAKTQISYSDSANATPPDGTPSYEDHTPVTGHSVAGVAGSVKPGELARYTATDDFQAKQKRRMALVGGIIGAAALFTLVALIAFGGADGSEGHATPPPAVTTPPKPEPVVAPASSASTKTETGAAPSASSKAKPKTEPRTAPPAPKKPQPKPEPTPEPTPKAAPKPQPIYKPPPKPKPKNNDRGY